MDRPKSFNVLLFFIVWSVFKAGESLLRTAGTKTIFEHYNLSYLYYADVLFVAIGGLAFAYAVYKAKPWGYVLGYVWLGIGVLTVLFTGLVSYLNKPLMIEILTLSREAKGREVGDVAGFVDSTFSDVTILGTTALLAGIMIFFAFKLHQHKSYFQAETN